MPDVRCMPCRPTGHPGSHDSGINTLTERPCAGVEAAGQALQSAQRLTESTLCRLAQESVELKHSDVAPPWEKLLLKAFPKHSQAPLALPVLLEVCLAAAWSPPHTRHGGGRGIYYPLIRALQQPWKTMGRNRPTGVHTRADEKTLSTSPDNFTSSPGPHRVEGENHLPQAILCPPPNNKCSKRQQNVRMCTLCTLTWSLTL